MADRAYDGGGFDDWYLPSRSELLLPWTHNVGLAQLNMGKNATYVWSSTQYPSYTVNAWSRRFSDGLESTHHKTNSLRVRPARRIKISI